MIYEVILYAAIATVVCAMLYSVLGKSTGQGPESALDPKQFMAPDPNEQPAVIDPIEEYGDFPDIGTIRSFDPSFSLNTFKDNAQGAYGMILEAYADGNRSLLGQLLTPKVYEVYDGAIGDRELKNLTQITDLARIMGTDVTAVSCDGALARISVMFESELASAMKNAEGEVVQGDPDMLSHSREVWSFERNMKDKSPNWLLADVAPSEGGPEADPTPDTE